MKSSKAVYKKLIQKRKREYGRHEGNNINFMRKHNPKMFYKLFAKRKSKGSNSNISMTEFMEHFKKLNESHGILDGSYQENDIDSNAIYEELDEGIELSEVMKAIKKLNCNKSNAEDLMINELFVYSKDILAPTLCKLFNSIFNSGLYPEAWAKGCVVPIFKKKEYRGP